MPGIFYPSSDNHISDIQVVISDIQVVIARYQISKCRNNHVSDIQVVIAGNLMIAKYQINK